MSLMALRKIFRDFDHSKLSQDFADCLIGNVDAINANQAAFRSWEQQDSERRMAARSTDTTLAPHAATLDPSPLPILSPTTQRAAQQPTQLPTPTCPKAAAHATIRLPTKPSTQPTVHRTEELVARGLCTQPDLALLVCPNPLTDGLYEAKRRDWEPHIIFLELRTTTPQNEKTVLNVNTANFKKGPKALVAAPS